MQPNVLQPWQLGQNPQLVLNVEVAGAGDVQLLQALWQVQELATHHDLGLTARQGLTDLQGLQVDQAIQL